MSTARHDNHLLPRAIKSAPDATRGVVLYQGCDPISGQTDIRVTACYFWAPGRVRLPYRFAAQKQHIRVLVWEY